VTIISESDDGGDKQFDFEVAIEVENERMIDGLESRQRGALGANG
jgi:hypothetical protein